MKLSVCIITYNQEDFICETLQSIVTQETDFKFEIIIGIDKGNDKTSDRIADFVISNNNDNIEFVIFQNLRNVGVAANFINVLKMARGEYIALCEGDDYWTDNLKITKMIDFMDNNKDFVISFHNTQIYYQDREKFETNPINNNTNEVTTIIDLLKGNYIMTLSAVFRNILKSYPDWFYFLKLADYPLFVLLSQYGKIKYFNEIMGVYRIWKSNTWFNIDKVSKAIHTKVAINYLQSEIKDKQYDRYFRKSLNNLNYSIFKNSLLIKNYKQAFQYFVKFLFTI